MKIKELRKKAMQLPLTPGVYLMKNSSSEIIYVGKAKALKNRVSQYFGSEHNHSLKVRKMVENVDDFEEVAARLALNPKLVARRAPERRHTLLDGGFEREFVDVADDENFARIGTLRNRGNDILGTLCDFLKLCKIEL